MTITLGSRQISQYSLDNAHRSSGFSLKIGLGVLNVTKSSNLNFVSFMKSASHQQFGEVTAEVLVVRSGF